MISIAIIGVVAAVTIPVFIDVMNGRAYKTKFQKTVSTLIRAVSANYGEEAYDFRDVSTFYGRNGVPVELYNSPTPAEDGATFGANTMGRTDVDQYSDLRASGLSIFNIFHSYLILGNASELNNWEVTSVPIEYSCPDYVQEGSTVKIKSDDNEITVAPITKFDGRLGNNPVQSSGGFASFCNGRPVAQGGFNQGRMFIMHDGSVFTYDPSQAYCTENNPCFGYIDVNGPKPPNKVIACSKGVDSYILTYSKNDNSNILKGSCEVKSQDITDIYPVLFYTQIVKPASWAAKTVYYDGMKSNQVGDVIVPEE